MCGAIPPLTTYACMAWCSVEGTGINLLIKIICNFLDESSIYDIYFYIEPGTSLIQSSTTTCGAEGQVERSIVHCIGVTFVSTLPTTSRPREIKVESVSFRRNVYKCVT